MNDLNEEQKKALKSFKKRLKMNQLEEDSKLGRSPLTGSRNNIVAIQPPREFAKAIWDDLVTKGYLVRDGGGFLKVAPGK